MFHYSWLLNWKKIESHLGTWSDAQRISINYFFANSFDTNVVSYISAKYCLNSFSLLSSCCHESHGGEFFCNTVYRLLVPSIPRCAEAYTYRLQMFHVKSYTDIERPAGIANRSYCVIVSREDLSPYIVFIWLLWSTVICHVARLTWAQQHDRSGHTDFMLLFLYILGQKGITTETSAQISHCRSCADRTKTFLKVYQQSNQITQINNS